jgi:hypothetical protein
MMAIVMLQFVDDYNEESVPVCVGRIHVSCDSGSCRVLSPDEQDIDDHTWIVQCDAQSVYIRPAKDELIFVDNSFGRERILPADLLELYKFLRVEKSMRETHRRLLRGIHPSLTEQRALYEKVVGDLSESISGLELKIAAKEAALEGDLVEQEYNG